MGLALAAVPTFAFADRFERKYVMLGGGTLTLLATVGVLVSTELPALLMFAAFFGAGEVISGAAGLAFLAEVTEGAARTRMFGVSYAAAALAGFVATTVGGALSVPIAAFLALPASDARTLRALLAIAAAVGASSGIPVLLLRRRSRAAHVTAPRRWDLLARLTPVWIAFGFGAGSFIPFVNLFFAERFGLGFAQVGVILGVISVGGALGGVVHTRLAPRLGDVRAISVAWAASLPFALAGALAPLAVLAAAALVVRGVLMTSVQPTWDAFYMSAAPPQQRSGMQAAAATVWAAGYGLGAFVSGNVRAALGDAGFTANMFTLVASYAVAIALFVAFFGRRPLQSR